MNPEKKEVYFVSTFYNFQKIQNVQNTSDIVSSLAIKRNIIGLIILAEEGFNATVACPFEKDFLDFKNDLLQFFGLTELNFKDSHSPHPPFRQFQIKIRKEIVTANAPHLVPDLTKDNNHLTPEQWNEVLKKEKHVHVIDTRNWYETQMGTFKNALNPQIDVFTDFPKFMDTQNVKKKTKF